MLTQKVVDAESALEKKRAEIKAKREQRKLKKKEEKLAMQQRRGCF
jgi:hypothetical protein